MRNSLALVLLTLIISGCTQTTPEIMNQTQESSNENQQVNETMNQIMNEAKPTEVQWRHDNNGWKPSGNTPACPEPLIFLSPADVSLASGILYPGQIRGTDYKPHGGFRFDAENNEVDVYAPMDANLFKAARHLDSGEVQYSLYFINNCGIMYKLDHLLELTNKFENILNTIPMGAEGDSRTTDIAPVFVAKGEHVATKIGYEKYVGGSNNRNIFFDFGVYDLRKENGVAYSPEFRAQHSNINEYGAYAICWFDLLPPEDSAIVKSLPAGGSEGKTSDYC